MKKLQLASRLEKCARYSTNATSVQGTNDQRFADFLPSGAWELLSKQLTSSRDSNAEIAGSPLRAALKKEQFHANVLCFEETNHFSASDVTDSLLFHLGNV